MKPRTGLRAIAGILLCAAGAWLAIPASYRERVYFMNASGCRLATTIMEKPERATEGSVVLFHGISANKKIMSYLAQGFAEQGLRVYAPDFPGHGRSLGPFSPARAEQCGEALVQELLSRGLIAANRTILAGHSMGGAIAVRIAARVPVAGVIAFSPAPMRAAHGVSAEKLLFADPPQLSHHSLLIVGSLELEPVRGNAAALVASRADGTTKYLEIPRATHVSLLFSAAAVRAAQEWAAQILALPPARALPSHRPLFGTLAGFAGLLLIAGPFVRETVGRKSPGEAAPPNAQPTLMRLFLEFAAGSILIVLLLQYWNPMKVIGVYQGDYLASFLLLFGALLAAIHWKSMRKPLGAPARQLAAAAFAALVLFLLVTAWFDLTFYEAWLTSAKWARFLFLLAVLLPYQFAEETLLGPVKPGTRWRRLTLALSLRLIIWSGLMAGVLYLHSGEILMGLLSPYMAVFNLVQRSGMDMVRNETGSAAATALFGAILLAGLCLVIFPIT